MDEIVVVVDYIVADSEKEKIEVVDTCSFLGTKNYLAF